MPHLEKLTITGVACSVKTVQMFRPRKSISIPSAFNPNGSRLFASDGAINDLKAIELGKILLDFSEEGSLRTLNSVTQLCPNLQSLSLDLAKLDTKSAVEQILGNLVHLECLTLSNITPNTHGLGIFAPLMSNKKLRELTLSLCQQVESAKTDFSQMIGANTSVQKLKITYSGPNMKTNESKLQAFADFVCIFGQVRELTIKKNFPIQVISNVGKGQESSVVFLL